MSKTEIRDNLKKSGKFDTNSRDPLWIEAFNLYQQETRMKLSMSCGSCYGKVRSWLNS